MCFYSKKHKSKVGSHSLELEQKALHEIGPEVWPFGLQHAKWSLRVRPKLVASQEFEYHLKNQNATKVVHLLRGFSKSFIVVYDMLKLE